MLKNEFRAITSDKVSRRLPIFYFRSQKLERGLGTLPQRRTHSLLLGGPRRAAKLLSAEAKLVGLSDFV